MRLPYLPDFHEEHCLDHIPFPFQLIKRGSIGRHVLILNIHCDKGVSDYLFSMQLICLSFFRATFLRNEKSRVGLMVTTAHKLYYITLFVKCNIRFVRSLIRCWFGLLSSGRIASAQTETTLVVHCLKSYERARNFCRLHDCQVKTRSFPCANLNHSTTLSCHVLIQRSLSHFSVFYAERKITITVIIFVHYHRSG